MREAGTDPAPVLTDIGVSAEPRATRTVLVNVGDKLKVVSMAPLLSETIRRICCNKSVSELF